MTIQSSIDYTKLDAYDIAVLFLRMWTYLSLKKRVDSKTAYRMATEATLEDLLRVKEEWMREKRNEFDARYRKVRAIFEESSSVERLVESPAMRDSRAYREWVELRSRPPTV